MSWLIRAERLLRPLIQLRHRLARGMTLGVRGVVLDGEGRVLLLEHTYVRGWHLPGGGVEKGETATEALERELIEEAGVRMAGPPVLLSVHNNDALFPGDHVLVYRIDRWEACDATSRGEIKAVAWFDPLNPPEDVTQGTRRRIEEAIAGRSVEGRW